jgi:hypothetical protein
MLRVSIGIGGLAALVLLSLPARAGLCTAGADETANIVLLANELAFPTWNGGSNGFLEPFTTIYASSVGILGDSCPEGCPFLENEYGDVSCGDLAADPLEFDGSVEIVGIPDPQVFTIVLADLYPDGRLSVGGQGFISPASGASRDATRTFADFQAGYREVFDVSSAATTPQEVVVNFYVGRSDHGGFNGTLCQGPILTRNYDPEVKFRLRQVPASGPPTPEMLIDVTWDDLDLGNNYFVVDMLPNAVVYMDVYAAAQVQATGDNVVGADECDGGLATCDFFDSSAPGDEFDGFQVYLSPAPGLAMVSRSGLVYEPVPEPQAGLAGVVALASLARRLRRQVRGSTRSLTIGGSSHPEGTARGARDCSHRCQGTTVSIATTRLPA